MKTLRPTKAWILLCSIILVSYAAPDYGSSYHDGLPRHGANIPRNRHQKPIVPIGIQMPEHVLLTQEIACISADINIFEIMNKAQEFCAGNDMRCTFYYYSNHGYQNIGTLDIDKKLFDGLLMKYDNWLVTAENIVNAAVPYLTNRMTGVDNYNLDTGRNNVNNGHNDISSHQKNQGSHIGEFDHNTNEPDDVKVNHIKTHHIKTSSETHHQKHNNKENGDRLSNVQGKTRKNGNYIKLNPEYNDDRKYFEVFLPKDKNKGEPRTIYVEVDDENNEYVLFDEEIDKKLNSDKKIIIELDELSENADVAFNVIAKSTIDNQNIPKDYSNDDERVMISNIDTNFAINEAYTNSNIEDPAQNILQPSVLNSNHLNAKQNFIFDDTTENSKSVVQAQKNIVAPNKYMNQAQFNVASQLNNPAHDWKMALSSNIEPDIHQTDMYEDVPLNTSEDNNYNIDTKVDLDGSECSPSKTSISNQNDNDDSSEIYKLSRKSENVDLDDDFIINLVENNNFNSDIDFENTNDFSYTRLSDTLHLNEPVFHVENPYQENNLIFASPKITPYQTAKISDFTGSEVDSIPFQNQSGHPVQQDLSSVPGIPLPPYITVPLLAKELETDPQLQSSFPVYATLDLPADSSQNTLLNSGSEDPSAASNIPQFTSPILPSPPYESVVRLNKVSKYSPLNVGFSWLPSYLRIQELRLPFSKNPTPLESAAPLPEYLLPLPLPNKEYSSSLASTSPDRTIPVEDPGFFQSVPSHSAILQKPSITTNPFPLELAIPMSPEYILSPSKLDLLPKSNVDFDIFPSNFLLNDTLLSVMPLGPKDAVNLPCPVQQTPQSLSSLQPIKPNLIDLNSAEPIPIYNQNYRTIPWSTKRFENPHNTIPQLIPLYLEPRVQLRPIPKVVTQDTSQLFLAHANPRVAGDYFQGIRPISYIPFLSNTPISPLARLFQGPRILPNTMICPNVINKIPYYNIPSLPCTALPDKSILNYPSTVANDLTHGIGLQQDQILKQLLRDFPLSVVDHPYLANNIFEMTPSSHNKPLLPICSTPVQMDLRPRLNFNLDRNLPILPSQHIIQQPNILDKEFLDALSKNLSPPLEQTLQNQYSNLVFDSSLVGSHLPKLSTTKPLLTDKNRNMNKELFESNLTELTPLDSSLIGPYLETESPPLMLNSNNFHSKTSSPHSELRIVSSTQDEPPINIKQNQTTNLLLENSLIGPHLTTLSMINPVLNDEIQSIHEVIPLDFNVTDLMSLDSSLIDTQVDFENPVQEEKSAVTLSEIPSPELYEPIKSLEVLPLESEFINSEPLDTSLIGPRFEIGSSPIIIDSVEHKTIPTIPQHSLQNTGVKVADSESNILPSSLLPSSLDIPSNADLNVNTISQSTQLYNDLDEVSLDTITSQNILPKLSQPIKSVPELIQSTQFYQEPLTDSLNVIPLTIDSSIPRTLSHTDFKIIEPIPELPSLDNKTESLLSKDSTVSQQGIQPLDMSPVLDSENELNSSLIGPSLHQYKESLETPVLDTKSQLESSLIWPSLHQEMEITEKPVLDTRIQLESSLIGPNLHKKIESIEIPIVVAKSQLDSSLIGPALQREINPLEIPTLDSKIQLNNSLIGLSLHEEVKPSEILTTLDDTQLDCTPIGSSLHQEIESKEVLHVLESSSQLDTSLIGPNLPTTPLINDKFQNINEELQSENDLTNLIPLDSSLIDTQADFVTQLTQSEISRYENPALLLSLNPTSLNSYESTEFLPSHLIGEELPSASTSSEIKLLPSDLVGEGLPLESTESSIYTSDLQKLSPLLMSPFLISKPQLYPLSESKSRDEVLSSTAKISSDNTCPTLSSTDLQMLTLNTLLNTPTSLLDDVTSDIPSLPLTLAAQKFSPIKFIKHEHPCLESDVMTELLSYPGFDVKPDILSADKSYLINKNFYKNVPFGPQIPTSFHSPFVQIKPLLNHDWQVPQSLNIQNIPQASPGLRPALSGISGTLLPLSSEFSKPFLDVTSNSKPCPQILIPEIDTTLSTILPPPLESNILLLDNYIPPLPKKTSSVFPLNLESTNCNSKYSSVLIDDIMPLLDDNSFQLPKDISILPLSQSFITSTFSANDKGKTVSPSPSPSLLDTIPILNMDFIKTPPFLSSPITNPIAPLEIYSNPQDIPIMVQRPNIPPCNLQPYSDVPLDAKFYEIPQSAEHSIIPETTSTPLTFFDDSKMTQPCCLPLPKPVLEDDKTLLPPLSTNTFPNAGYFKYMPQMVTKPYSLMPQYKTLKSPYSTPLLETNSLQTSINSLIPQQTLDSSLVYSEPTESQLGTNVIVNSEFSQQLLSKPCLEPLDTSSQSSTASNEPVHFTPVSLIHTPVLPTYSRPLSVSYAKPISNTIPLSPIHLYSDSPASSTSPLIPVKSTPFLDYAYPPTTVQTIPISSAVFSKPPQTCSSPYLPIDPKPFPINASPYSPTFMSKLTESLTKPESLMYSHPISAPYFNPVPKELSNLGSPAYSRLLPPISTSPIAPMHADILSPSYVSPVTPTYSYVSLPSSMKTLTGPSSFISPTYVNPILNRDNHLPCNMPLSSSSSRPLDLKSQVATPQSQILGPLETLPVSYAINPFLNANQRLPIVPSILPQSYPTPTPVPISFPLPVSDPKINDSQKNIPCEEILECNLQASPSTEEVPCNIQEERICTCNDEDDKFDEKLTFAPEEITETLPDKYFTKHEDLIHSSPVNSLANEPALQSNLYQRPRPTPYSPYYSIPCLAPTLPLPSPSLIETVPSNLLENIPIAPSKTPFSLSPSIILSPLMRPLSPISPTLVSPNSKFPLISNVPCLPPLSPISPLIDNGLSPCNILPMNEKPQYLPMLLSLYDSALSQKFSKVPIASSPLVKYAPSLPCSPIDSQGSPKSCIPFSSQNLPTVPNIPENYILLPPTNIKPKPNKPPCQDSLIKPSPLLSYEQYFEPIISHNIPAKDLTFPKNVMNIQSPISLQYLTPITSALKPFKPAISPQYISSILPTQTTLQDNSPINEAPINYQTYVPLSTKLPGKRLPVTLPYTVSPSFSNIDTTTDVVSSILSSPQLSSFTSQYSLPSPPATGIPLLPKSFSLPVSISPISSLLNKDKSIATPQITKQALADNVIPSSLFTAMVTDFQTPSNKLSALHNIPKYSLSSLASTEPLGIVPTYTPSRPLEQMILPQNILKPNTQFSQGQVPLSSSLFTQPLKPTDSFPSQPCQHFQYTTQPHPKLSPVTGQYIPQYLSQSLTSLPLNTVPNEPNLPQHSASVYNTPISLSPLVKNPFINSDFKTIPEVSSSPISSPKIIPSNSIILSNLLPVDTSQDLESYSSSITSAAPLYSSSLLKPLVKSVLQQKVREPYPQINPFNSPYALESLLSNSAPQLVPSTSSLLKSSLLKPLLTNPDNNTPLLPIPSLNTVFPEMAPSKYLPPIFSNEDTFGPISSLISKLPEIRKHVNTLPTTPYSLLKSPFINHIEPQYIPVGSLPSMLKSSISPLLSSTKSTSLTSTDTELYPSPIIQYLPTPAEISLSATGLPSNRLNTGKPLIPIAPHHSYSPSRILTSILDNANVSPNLKHSPSFSTKANIIKAVKPIEVSGIPISDFVEADMTELIEPYEIISELKDSLSPLPPDYSQHIQFDPVFIPNFVPLSKPTHTTLPLQNKISQTSQYSSPIISPLLSNEAEILDTTDFIPISLINTEPVMALPYQTPLLTNTPSKIPIKPSVNQLLPYTTLLNTDYPQKSTVNQYLPSQLQPPRNNNQISQPSPVYISPLQNRDFTEDPLSCQAPLSSNVLTSPLTSANIGSQLSLRPLISELSPPVSPNLELKPFTSPLQTSPQLLKPQNWRQLPIFAQSLPIHEKPIEVIPETENVRNILNKYRPTNVRPTQTNRPYGLKPFICQPLELDSAIQIAPVKPEPMIEYEEDIESNDINYIDNEIIPCVPESEKIYLDETKPNVLCLSEMFEGLSVPNYNTIPQRPQRLSKLDNFYANNHIGPSPQVFNIPTYNKLLLSSHNYVKNPSNISPEICKDFTTIPTVHFVSPSKLHTLIPNDNYIEISQSPTNLPQVTKLFPKNFLNPGLEPNPQIKPSPNTMELPGTYHPSSYTPYDNTENIKYMGYKTYQIPSLKSKQTPQNLQILPHVDSHSLVSQTHPVPVLNLPNMHQRPTPPHIYRPIEMPDHIIPQYQNPVKITSPFQSKLDLNTIQQSPKSNEYNLLEDIPVCSEYINEDNELITTLVNYINKKEEIKNNLYNNNAEVTIPIGNIAITKNEPCQADTLETNNPSIGLKVWKSKVKVVQAELKLKLKELSVNNFMPIVNNLNKYDVEEIRKIVKNYIDEKYGNHIEVNEPYTINNKYTVIKDFDYNAVNNFNLLWPTNYV